MYNNFMNSTNLYIFLSIIIVSLFSFIGIIALAVKKERLEKITMFLVAISAGTLLGDAFLHLLPEAIGDGINLSGWITIIAGMLAFFIMEKIVFWRHCHVATSESHPHPFGIMNLIGDGLHNFIDGMIIAGSFLTSIPLGLTTTVAIIAHEIPQEISDFGVLLHAGFSKKKALLMNFVTALTSILGAILIIAIDTSIENITNFIIPFTAGGFIYIASADLIPELHKETEPSKSFKQLLSILLGIILMLLLKKIC